MIVIATVLHSPYKGLAPFEDSELDALLFFGRERESEIVVANLVASRLTILYGPSGVGKTSLLRAAVARDLRALPERPVVAVHSDWAEDPAPALAAAIAEQAEFEQGPSLVETVEAAVIARGEIYLILDQLEEYFLYHGGERDPWSLAEALPELVTRTELPVHVLLGVREDAVARLDAFSGRLPLLFSNQLRLDHLDRKAARRAILGPLDRFAELVPDAEAMTIEPELVDAVLDGVEAGKVVHGPGGRGVVKGSRRRRLIETPYLQLVLQRLWEEERGQGSQVLRLETLERLGGAAHVVEDHLERALEGLSSVQKETAAAVFNHLVTPSGTKIAHEVGDLASYADIDEAELAPVLRALATERIVKPVAVDGGERGAYEIFHDVLAAAVLGWRTRFRAERALAAEREGARRRHRRLAAAAVVSLVAFLAMALVTIFALSERKQANEQERAARAGELSARALVELDIDPQQSLEWARSAAELEPSSQAEVVLRRALLAARLRRVLRLGSPVTLAAYSPDGSDVLLARSEGGAVLWDARRRHVVRTLDAGGGPVVAASFDRSGARILTAQGATAVIWDRSSGARLTTIELGGAVTDARFSHDGSQVLTASEDGTVRLFRARDGRRLRVLHLQGRVTKVVLSKDDRTLVVVQDGQLLVKAVPYSALADERQLRVDIDSSRSSNQEEACLEIADKE